MSRDEAAKNLSFVLRMQDSLAAEQAIQDAMARFMIEFQEQPEVKRCFRPALPRLETSNEITSQPIASLSVFLFLTACTTIQTQSEFQNSISLSPLDNVVLLSNLASDQDFSDKDLDRCIRPAMFDAAPELHIIPAKQFRENLYPYFTPSTTPRD